jgi:hypothetical protein
VGSGFSVEAPPEIEEVDCNEVAGAAYQNFREQGVSYQAGMQVFRDTLWSCLENS